MLTGIGNKILVDPLFEPDQIGSIIVPDQAKARANQGIVKYIGPDVKNVQVGDHVLFGGYVGTTIHLEGEGVLIVVEEEFIQCIVHDEVLSVPGLYFKTTDGDYIPATYETGVRLLRDAIRDSDVFKAQMAWRKKRGYTK